MPSERTLLNDFEGCVKCRKFFAGHRARDCTNDFPSPVGYWTLTMDDVNAARRRGRAVASIQGGSHNVNTDAAHQSTSSSTSMVAAVMPAISSSVLHGDNSNLSKDSDDSVSPMPSVPFSVPFSSPHLLWDCVVHDTSSLSEVPLTALMDNGSHVVLIRADLVDRLKLRRHSLPVPMPINLAMSPNPNETTAATLTEWVKLKLYDKDGLWCSRTVRAVVAEDLCYDVILGLPFLNVNGIVIDHAEGTCVDKKSGFDLLHPHPLPRAPVPKKMVPPIRKRKQTVYDRQAVLIELKTKLKSKRDDLASETTPVDPVCFIGAVRSRIEVLAHTEHLKQLGVELKNEFSDVFEPLPHVNRLSTEIFCKIELKDCTKKIESRTYGCPRKYREAWKTLIQQHLDAGQIRPSSSTYAFPAFIIPKSDPSVLPCWVNDYRQLNANTVTDSYPLPRVDDILVDAGKAKIWSVLDMTNSFFPRAHPDSIHLTAVMTPFGLYEWLVMPMGLRNAPPIHQRRVANALRDHIGKICHIYLDDIIIYSNSVEEHLEHVKTILRCLHDHGLCLNTAKSKFLCEEVDFLGHHISACGIEPKSDNVERILNWPRPNSATTVWSFLGIVWYLAAFLPHLAEHTCKLSPLTMKDCEREFPPWTSEHEQAFEAIKALVLSRECLTVINHDDPGDNKIFVTCDASDLRTGAVLSWGPTWEKARPVAFDSMQLNDAQKTSASAIRQSSLVHTTAIPLTHTTKTLPELPSLLLALDTMRQNNPNDVDLRSILPCSLAYGEPTPAAVRRWASGASQC